MIIAIQKRKENIVEYLLYMFQVEDSIRACDLDINIIDKQIISKYNINDDLTEQIHQWYENLLLLMKTEKVDHSGHIQVIANLIMELNELHLYLLKQPEQYKYKTLYESARPLMFELYDKLKADVTNEVEIALTILYRFVFIKIKKVEVSQHSVAAMKIISAFLKELAVMYSKYEKGDLVIE